jgi:foldase protein PrsA
MRSTRNQIGIVLLVCVLLLALAALLSASGGVDDSDVADVHDSSNISKQDFNRWFGIISSQPQPGQKKKPAPPKQGSREYEAAKQQAMSYLISARWIEGEAKERGVSASDEEIKRRFEQVKDQSFPNEKAYQRFLKTSGQQEPDLLFRVRLDVLGNKVRENVTAGATNVSEGEIEKYYNDNKSQFEQPERRDVEVVKTKTSGDAQEALKRLKSGERFKKVVADLSIDPATKNQDGRLIAVSKGQQEGAFDAAIFSAVKNKIAGPIKTDTGYYVFRVNKIVPGTKQSLDQSKQGIKQLLASQNQQKKLDQFSTNFRNTWRQRTDCAEDYVIPDCRNGRQEQPPAPPPTGKQPVKGSTGAAPPALDGTGAPLVGVSTGGTAIGQPQGAGAAGGLGSFSSAGGANLTQSAPLALGGAPKEGATGAPPGGITLPGGAAPGGQTQQVPPGQ